MNVASPTISSIIVERQRPHRAVSLRAAVNPTTTPNVMQSMNGVDGIIIDAITTPTAADRTLALAGIWTQTKQGELTAAILTTSPNQVMARLHHRMPPSATEIRVPVARAGATRRLRR